MIIAMPSASKEQINKIYNSMQDKFGTIKILPSMSNILKEEEFTKQLKDITVEDLRPPLHKGTKCDMRFKSSLNSAKLNLLNPYK